MFTITNVYYNKWILLLFVLMISYKTHLWSNGPEMGVCRITCFYFVLQLCIG